MELRPTVNSEIRIDGERYLFTEHPVAKNMPYGQTGRRATVYQLRSAEGHLKAFKIFTQAFRSRRVAEGAQKLLPYAGLPGLQVCRRSVLTPETHSELLLRHENLLYAVVMPWVYGETWQEFLLGGQKLSQDQALALAQSFAHVLREMEARHIAHCDLSGPNVLLPGLRAGGEQDGLVALVDVEDLYGPDLDSPEKLPGGSMGYGHRTAPLGIWAEEGDRFAGGVLLAEMLGWSNDQVRQIAYGEQYFDLAEMQQNSERYQILLKVLKQTWGAPVADLLAADWASETLNECPTLTAWSDALGKPPDDAAALFASGTAPRLQVSQAVIETPQERLVRSTLERADILMSLGQTERAIQELTEAYRISPEVGGKALANALLRRGEGEERTGNLEGALADYRRAFSVAPTGGLRDELATIVEEVVHKAELAKSSMAAQVRRCPKCGRELLPGTDTCPVCSLLPKTSEPSRPMPRPQPKKKSRWWLWTGLVVLILGVCGVTGVGLYSLFFGEEATTSLTSSRTVVNTPQEIILATSTPRVVEAESTSLPQIQSSGLPGQETMPMGSFSESIPWLPFDPQYAPSVMYINFNVGKLPMNNPVLRQALSFAVDRERIVEVMTNEGYSQASPASSLVPTAILGRDLTGAVGSSYDLTKAKNLLEQAGYKDGSGLPPLVMAVFAIDPVNSSNALISKILQEKWRYLGLGVELKYYDKYADYVAALPDSHFSLSGWIADFNDPDNFYRNLLYSGGEFNRSGFSNAEFDDLVDNAAQLSDPADRMVLYMLAEQMVNDDQVPVVPLAYYVTDVSETQPTSTTGAKDYFDDFSDTQSGWPTIDEGTYAYGYHEGMTYYMQQSSLDKYLWVTIPHNLSTGVKDIAVSTDAIVVEGTGAYGLICRYQDNDNYYVALVAEQSGYYEILKKVGGEFTTLVDWTTTDLLYNDQINNIGISCEGNDIGLDINGIRAQTISDRSLPTSGVVRLVIDAFEDPNGETLKILFDNVLVREP